MNLPKEENVHAKHRERMRDKLRKHGANTFETHELLEFVLYNTINRSNTNPIAHKLIKQCDGLIGMFNTSYSRLKSIKGVGDKSALFLLALGELYKRAVNETAQAVKLKNNLAINEYCISLFEFENREKVYALCLDENSYLVATIDITKTSANTNAEIDLQKAFSLIAECAPKYVVLTHNHVTNSLNISLSDGKSTIYLYKVLKIFNILLFDHVIVNNHKTVSFFEKGLMEKIEIMVKNNVREEDILDKLELPLDVDKVNNNN